MEAFHPLEEVKETVDDSGAPTSDGISEKWLREKIDSLIPIIQEKWPTQEKIHYLNLKKV